MAMGQPLRAGVAEITGGEWGPPPEAAVGSWGLPPEDDTAAGPTEVRTSRRKSIFVVTCTMLLSVPAIIGSWCWPIFLGVVVGMLSGQSFGTAGKNASSHGHVIAFFHGLQVAIMMTVMLNIVQYAYWTVLSKRRHVVGHWNKFGPVYLILVAAILVNVQPMLILIIGSWYPAGGCMDPTTKAHYANYDDFPCTNAFWDPESINSFFPTRAPGWLIQIFCTYGGFVFMIVGVVQATELHKSLRRIVQEASA